MISLRGRMALGFLATALAVVPAPAAVRAARVVAVGDVHGSAEGLSAILRATGLIDRTGAWIAGGGTTFVQLGDFMDRGSGVREVMDLLMSVERGAAAAGSRVHVLLGNHEAMNLLGDTRDVTSEIVASFADAASQARREQAWRRYEKFGTARVRRMGQKAPRVLSRDEWMAEHPLGYLEYRAALTPDGQYGRWLRTRPAIVRIDDTLFVHGGLHPGTAPSTVEHLNKRVEREIRQFDEYRRHLVHRGLILPFFTLQEVIESAVAELQAIVSRPDVELPLTALDRRHLDVLQETTRVGTWMVLDPEGPLWFRGYARWSQAEWTPQVSRLLARFGARRIVVGHTVPPSKLITPRFDGQVFLIDTGMLTSCYEGGRASALEIEGDHVAARYEDREMAPTFTSPMSAADGFTELVCGATRTFTSG
jgi:hypothetical protein